MIARPEMVMQLCKHHVRPTLIESNPPSVAAVLDDINKDPLSMAIWNDATTFIDIGDITARRGGRELDFIELKQGKVNEAIYELHKTMTAHRRAGEPEKAHQAIDDFYAAYGRKGFTQLMRVMKQLMRDRKAMDEVNLDLEKRGAPDPDIDIETAISESVAESYDPVVTQILRRAEANGAAIGCIDGCLWIYVFRGKGVSREQAVAEFSRLVFDASPATKAWLMEKTGRDVLNPVGSIDQWAFVPTALPPFLRLLEIEDVLDLLYGELIGRVLLFFDWLRFEDVVQRTGCALT